MDADEKQRMMEEHTRQALAGPNRFFEKSKPTYIENWPKELCSLSIPQVGLKLTRDQAERLGKNLVEFGAIFYPDEKWPEEGPPQIADIVTDLETIVQRDMAGAAPFFVRLGSRSPKDAFTTSPKVNDASQAIERLCDMSERVFEDLSLALHEEYDPYIWMRQWVNLPSWSEFRCFQRDRELIGISEYDYLGPGHPEIVENAGAIEWAIRAFWSEYFLPACHLDDVIFDVYVKRLPGMSTRDIRPDTGQPSYQTFQWEIKLLEINPFFNFTDPCLFDWREDGFDGEFRFRDYEPEEPTDKGEKYEERLS